jgi:tetratricopeptide (TPR) repeat protein
MNSFILKRAVLPLLTALAGVFLLAPAGATLQGLQVGAEAPDFNLKSFTGEPAGFAGLHGDKLTIVLFWATWSRNSEAALTRMEELYRRYRSDGLGVIAVNANGQTLSPEAEADILATAKRLDLTFPLLLDDRLRTFHDFGVIALPTLVVLSPERTIRYEMSGYPLTGVGDMVDFVTATVEGRTLKPEVVQKTGYQPDSRALHFFNMGRKTLKSRRMMDTAEMWFKKAVAADDRFVEPRLSLGRFYLSRKEYDKAAEQFSGVLAQEPENVVALCEGAMLLDGQGRPEEAIAMLRKTMQKDPYYTPCYYYLGYLTGREGSLEDALPLFDQALEINRASADIPLYMGRMYEERQEPQLAAEAYRKALETLLRGR